MGTLRSLTILCLSCILLITTSTIHCQQNSDSLIVETKSGRARGITLTSSTGKDVDTWLGIPYAEKPLGDLRFRHPQPVQAWNGILNATQNPNSCVQRPNTGDEDCLYLTITVPKPRPTNSSVMVWIHGGAYISGSHIDSNFDYKTMASEGNIILVGMNYRLDSLGFLYFGTADAPGNAGLFDQNLALKWIHDNIASFGGDPNKITVFGESAGSVSISFHLLSPHSVGLFSKAILESGSANAPSLLHSLEQIEERGLYLANAVGCPHDINNIREITDCLKNINALTLVDSEYSDSMRFFEFPFTPIVDGNFVPDDPNTLLDNKRFQNVNIMAGTNSDEGIGFVMEYFPNLLRNQENITVNGSQFLETVDSVCHSYDNKVKNAILFEYTYWSDPDNTYRNVDALDKIVGDPIFTCSTIKLADSLTDTANDVYFYYYTHKTSFSSLPSWAGVLHAAEIPYVFGVPLNSSYNYTKDEIVLSRRMLTYWTNFAKTGNPNTSPDGNTTTIHWPIRTSTGREFLELNVNSSIIGRGPRPEQCAFWNYYVPQLNDPTDESNNSGQESKSQWYFVTLTSLLMVALSLQYS